MTTDKQTAQQGTQSATSVSADCLKFQNLLRELFQFDLADLDFGIYRILNHKRDVIEKFVVERLPATVEEELDRGILAEQAWAAEEMENAAELIREHFARDAFKPDGSLRSPHDETVLGKKYLRFRELSHKGSRSRAGIETDIYNHLYAFFSRYYDGGDIMSQRRYSRRQRYAVPYNGEEVLLHWANKGQYYVKTAEVFRDYAFSSKGVNVDFKLVSADVEQDNVKGDKRFFVPRVRDMTWDERASKLELPFEYRPLSRRRRGKGKKARGNGPQEQIIERALIDVPRRLEGMANATRAHAALTAERRTTGGGQVVTVLEHHLRQYTKRNTSDYFVHKDLKGFLSQELDFYVKNEVMNLDNVVAAGEERSEGWFQTVRVLASVGHEIIEFLDQIESFQKMLWEKRKFVTETQYCVAVGCIDHRFYPEVAACEEQWSEWQDLLSIDEDRLNLFNATADKAGKRIEFLRRHPTLALDTRHFAPAFVDQLMGSFEDLEAMTAGTLVHGENWQALRLLEESHRGQVDCIYIDPPYNTGQNEKFVYKDNYRHSSWLSMMNDRLAASRTLASQRGGILVSTDDGEYATLRGVLEQTWGRDNFVADVIWNSRKSVSSDALISISTNHTTFFAADRAFLEARKTQFRLPRVSAKFSNPDDDPMGPWALDPMDAPNVRENLVYPIVNPATGQEHWPPEGRCWRFDKEKTERLLADGRIVFGRTGAAKPMCKRYLQHAQAKGTVPTTLWDDVKTTTDATKLMLNLFGNGEMRGLIDEIKPKPTQLVERCALLLARSDGTVLDYFAGSGTTAHAVVNLNRHDGGARRFVLVEMGEYFDQLLLPRLKKVVFTPEWKGGKPKRMATPEEAQRAPQIVKYQRIESYEDALSSITFDDEAGQRAMELEGYVLGYMLKWETKDSQTLLNVFNLDKPFSYTLRTRTNGQAREVVADLPETFNYLLGLRVTTRRSYSDDGRRYLVYTGAVGDRRVTVIWRDTEGWGKAERVRDKEFVAAQGLAEGADQVFVNGSSFIREATALDPIFKKRMFRRGG